MRNSEQEYIDFLAQDLIQDGVGESEAYIQAEKDFQKERNTLNK